MQEKNIYKNGKSYLWSNHIDYLTQNILKKHRLLSHAFHSMQLLLIKKLQLIPCQNSISIQVYALKPDQRIQSLMNMLLKSTVRKDKPVSEMITSLKLIVSNHGFTW